MVQPESTEELIKKYAIVVVQELKVVLLNRFAMLSISLCS
jgi:hypothetical protein